MGGRLATLYGPGDLVEAHLIEARLEEAGIQGFIENEATSASALPGIGAELGTGPIILVPADRLEEARAVLEAFLREREEAPGEEETREGLAGLDDEEAGPREDSLEEEETEED